MMTEKMLSKASRDLADTGACRALLVSDVELPADQSRVDQENPMVECLAMAGLTVDKDGIVSDINSRRSAATNGINNAACCCTTMCGPPMVWFVYGGSRQPGSICSRPCFLFSVCLEPFY